MSGGSYEYLCHKEASGLLSGHWDEELQRMADRLAGLGYATDAARETQEALLVARQCRNRLDAYVRRLHRLWRAVEWVDSGDSNEDYIQEELRRYRGEDQA